MSDPTEGIRMELVGEINSDPGSRPALEKLHGRVWDTDQIRAEFDVIGFMAPFMIVKRKIDGAKGTLMFQHQPRFYWGFQVD